MPAGRPLLLALALLGCAGCVRPALRQHRVSTGWWQIGTQHVALTTDLPRQTAVELAWAFEDTARALAHVLPPCPAFDRDAIFVVVFDDPAAYQRIAPTTTAAAFFHRVRDGVSPFPSYIAMSHVHGQAQTFAHEVTHRWVDACAPTLPIWINEGLAMTLETLRVHEHDIELGVPPFRFEGAGPDYGVREDGSRVMRIERSALPAAHELRTLSSADWLRVDDERARTASYAAAWALVHRFLVGGPPEERAAFRAYLTALRAFDATSDEVLEQEMGAIDLDAALTSYTDVSQRLHVDYQARWIARPGARHLADGEVHLLLGSLLGYAGDATASARELAQVGEAERLDARLVAADLATTEERAQIVADAVASTPGGDRRLTRARAVVALEAVDSAAAHRALAELERLQAPATRDLVLMARLENMIGAHERAIALARRALEEEPSSFRAREVMGRSLRALHRGDEAVPWLRGALALAPTRAAATVPELEGELRAIACMGRMSAVTARAAVASVPDDATSLAPDAIALAIRARQDGIHDCYQQAIARGALEGRVDARMVVAPEGRVRQVDVCSTVGDDVFTECVRGTLATLAFPAAERTTEIWFPFVFERER